MENLTIAREADARGSFCPGPLLELIRLVRDSHVGDVIAVISSDAGSQKDIPAWINKAKFEYLGSEEVEGAIRFLMRKNH